MRRYRDLTGMTFGRLTVASLHGKDRYRFSMWECSCSCGNTCIVRSNCLLRRGQQSCGCIRLENKTTHGLSDSPEYRVFRAAMNRCRNPNNPAYKDYGGRGIQFLFPTFESYLTELGRRPSEGMTVDRIDNNGNYEPGNVRWVTPFQQVHNRRIRCDSRVIRGLKPTPPRRDLQSLIT